MNSALRKSFACAAVLLCGCTVQTWMPMANYKPISSPNIQSAMFKSGSVIKFDEEYGWLDTVKSTICGKLTNGHDTTISRTNVLVVSYPITSPLATFFKGILTGILAVALFFLIAFAGY